MQVNQIFIHCRACLQKNFHKGALSIRVLLEQALFKQYSVSFEELWADNCPAKN